MASSISTPVRSARARPTGTSSSIDCSAETSSAGARHDAGFVLVSVIWVVLFLALAVASFTLSVRSHVQEASAVASGAEAMALADAGAHLALHDLVNAQVSRTWQRRFPADGRSYACNIGGSRVRITVADEAGKVDLNAASEGLLRALIAGAGLSGADADRLTAAILDFRDTDNVRSRSGAEAGDYRQAGRQHGPKNAPFDSTLELAQVLGVDAALIARVRPFVTVHSGLQGVDPSKTSPELLALLAAGASFGQPPGDFAEPAAGAGRLPAALPAALAAVSTQRVFSIRSQATGEQGATFARETVVRVLPSRSRLYSVLVWRQGNATDGPYDVDLGVC